MSDLERRFLGKPFIVRPEYLDNRAHDVRNCDACVDAGGIEVCVEINGPDDGEYAIIRGDAGRDMFAHRCIPLEEYLQTLP